MKVAIIGGGPIGLEAALYGAVAGHDVQLFERGRLAENVRQWGHVGLFTEWGRNRSPLAARLLADQGYDPAPADSYSTGAELADYVQRVASLAPLRGKLCPQTEVVALCRDGCLKGDFWGLPEERAARPFRLITRGLGGERARHFDAVIDASGSYASPNWVGNGGAPCPGESALQGAIDYQLPDVAGTEKGRFGNKHTLVVGSGHSAASTALAVADLWDEAPRTRLTWVIRRGLASSGEVYWLDPNDQLSGRQKLARRANILVNDPRVDFRFGTVVESLARQGGEFRVQLSEGAEVKVHNVVAHTGLRSDPALWTELQVTQHPATGGPFGLSESIMEANRRAGVGLSTGYAERLPVVSEVESAAPVPAGDIRVASPSLLRLGEPNFFVIGIKSYGRDAGFLMQNGFRQVRDVYRLLAGNDELDLYDGII